MSLYLDTEFNGFKGKLISLALYNTHGVHWYEVYPYAMDKWIDPWVTQNVISVLNKKPVTEVFFQHSLVNYLNDWKDETVYADWPEDFIHLLSQLCGQKGLKLLDKLKMELITVEDKIASTIPHNALMDAHALYLNHTWPKEEKKS